MRLDDEHLTLLNLKQGSSDWWRGIEKTEAGIRNISKKEVTTLSKILFDQILLIYCTMTVEFLPYYKTQMMA